MTQFSRRSGALGLAGIAALAIAAAGTFPREAPAATGETEGADAVIRLVPVPASVVAACRRAQSQVSYPFLCPSLLPRPSRVRFNGRTPIPLEAAGGGGSVHIGYDAEAGSKLGLNHPRYFLHFVIGRADQGVPPGARPARLGGRRGLLAPASSKSYYGPYFGNHVRFLWRANGTRYVATLHTFGERATERLLDRLLRTLRPARELTPYRPGDPDGGRIVVPPGPRDLALGPEGLYVTSRSGLFGADALSHRVTRIDPDTLSTRVVPGVGERMLSAALGAGALWTVSTRLAPDPDFFTPPELARIDPSTGRVTARLRVGRSSNTQATGLAVTAGSVWVPLTRFARRDQRGVVWRIDPTSLSVLARIEVGKFPTQILAEGGSVWIVNAGDSTASRIDPMTNRVTDTIRVGRQPSAAAVTPGSLWIASARGDVVRRIDTASGAVVATIPIGGSTYGISVGDDGLWVALPGSGTLERIDPETNSVAESIEVGGDPVSVVSDGRDLWAAMSSDGLVLRIEHLGSAGRPALPHAWLSVRR